MNIFHTLAQKPWLAAPSGAESHCGGAAFSLPTPKVGLRLFLAVATMLFLLTVSAYVMRMKLLQWDPLTEPWLLWPNTVVLILSSIALQRAAVSARRGQMKGLRTGLLSGGILALVFLAGQLVVWQQLAAAGHFATTNPASAFFYLLTAFHGLHVIGGLVAWGRTTARAWRHTSSVEKSPISVELCAIYWHFLLVVWLGLFGLLLLT